MQRNPTAEWVALRDIKTWRIDASYNQIRIKGSAAKGYEPGRPFEVTLTVPENRSRTATSRFGAPGEAISWGPLPLEIEGKPIEWELHVQCTHADGTAISSKTLRENPWGVKIGNSREDEHTSTGAIFQTTSRRVKEEGNLLIGCPNIPGGVIVEVILLVTKY